MNIQQFNHTSASIKIAVYGESGTGKTRFCSTAPGYLFLSSEEKFTSVQSETVPYIKVKTLEELCNVITEINNTPDFPYHTLCIDSLSDIAERTLGEIPQSKDGRKDYFLVQEQCKYFLRMLPSIPYDMIIVFGIKPANDRENFRKYYPSLPGTAIILDIAKFFDFIFATRVGVREDGKTPIHYVQTKTDGQYTAKDCSDRLKLFETPDASYIFNLLHAPFDFKEPIPY